jgi:hypothetical protein
MWFIQAELQKNYCEMLDFNFLVTDFDILFKLPNYIKLHYITLHYITLHYITLNYIHIHFTDLTVASRQLNIKLVTNICKTTHTKFTKRHINMCKNIK